jgi:hypothetical protein
MNSTTDRTSNNAKPINPDTPSHFDLTNMDERDDDMTDKKHTQEDTHEDKTIDSDDSMNENIPQPLVPREKRGRGEKGVRGGKGGRGGRGGRGGVPRSLKKKKNTINAVDRSTKDGRR